MQGGNGDAPTQPGETAGRRGGRGSGEGFGRGQFANLTPEERRKMMESMGARGGNGRVGGRSGRGSGPAAPAAEPRPLDADKIDELFLPTPVRQRNGSVWTWDPAAKQLLEVRVVTGLADNQFSQLVSGDLKPGQQVVTSIIIPLTTQQRNAQNPLFGGQRGNFGGMQPGGGGGDRGGGGGNRGGGNIGFGGGGGGGGRGN
jgi:hypothetical protein